MIFTTHNHHHRQPSPPLPDGQDGIAIISFQAHPSLLSVFTKFCSNLHSHGSYFSLQRPPIPPPYLPPPQCYYSPSPPLTADNLVLRAVAPVRLTAPHRSIGDQGGTHRRARSSSLLQDPNTRVMLSHFPYPCFLDFYSPLH